jgi:hypothetical protein
MITPVETTIYELAAIERRNRLTAAANARRAVRPSAGRRPWLHAALVLVGWLDTREAQSAPATRPEILTAGR